MGKYGNAAVVATELFRKGVASSPNQAWEMAVAKIFPASQSSREKGCPRGAYLGLCESGAVSGIPAGSYCRSKQNKGYALKALLILKNNPALSSDEKTLWQFVMEGKYKTPNHQMDVVTSIWNAGLART